MRRSVGIPVGLLVALGFVIVAAGPALAGPVYNLFHFNVCGHKCETGNDTSDQPEDPVAAIVRSLTNNERERAASLNELCRNQYRAIVNQLDDDGWDARFVETAWKTWSSAPSGEEPYASDLCWQDGGEHDYGNAIFVRNAPITNTQKKYLTGTDNTNEHRAIVCVTAKPNASGAVATKWCSTHISASSSLQTQQIKDVANWVEAFKKPVVLSGDFNVEPDHDKIDPIYASWLFGQGASGIFEEVDQGDSRCRCGEGTNELRTRKIDYIFVQAADFVVKSGWVNNPTTDSDHDILRGQVQAS